MATGMVSMSESIQASIIIQHQLQQQLRQQQSRQHPVSLQQLEQQQQQKQQQQAKGIGLCVQILLVTSLFGIEMCVAFEQIYQILFLQYLGVPVSLVSVNGIVCGGTSMILLPVMGFLTDRGSNPKMRKLCSLLVGMFMFLGGLILLGACGFIKLAAVDAIMGNDDEVTTTSSLNITDGERLSTITSPATTGTPSSDGRYSNLPVTVFMSILGFACIDIGFDISVSLTRAFILESIPTFQHTRLLVMATVVQSMAGTTFSAIGCFDIPGAIGPVFNVDGVAATLILFCCLLFVIVIIGYGFTVTTGFVLTRKAPTVEAGDSNEKVSIKHPSPTTDVESVRNARRRFLKARTTSQLQQVHEDRPYVPDILHTEEGDASTRPLLLEDSLKGNNYSAMTISTASMNPNVDSVANETGMGVRKSHPRQQFKTTSVDSNAILDEANNENDSADDKADDDSDFEDVDVAVYEQQPVDRGMSAVLAAIRQSYSMSLSVRQPPLGEFHSRKLQQLQSKRLNEIKERETEKKKKMNKRLVLLCISSFFAIGSMLTFIIYGANTLTIGIFRGDPTALPGTEGQKHYEEGLRTAALGNVVLYATYMFISMNNKKIIDIIGEKAQYVLCHAFLLVSLITLIVTQLIEVYFVFMVFCGAFRTCVFTLPFVLANKFTQEEEEGEITNPDKPVKNIGKVMTLIGILIPTHYIILSIFMGPLMDTTGNVWVPLIYSAGSCAVSLVIFTSLFFVKN